LAREEWARSGQGKKAENRRCGLGIEAERSDDGLRLDMPNRGRTGRGWPPRGPDWRRQLHHGDRRHLEDKPSLSPEGHPAVEARAKPNERTSRFANLSPLPEDVGPGKPDRLGLQVATRRATTRHLTGRGGKEASPFPGAEHLQWFTCEDPAARRGLGDLVKGKRRDAKVSPLGSVSIMPPRRPRPLSAGGRSSR